MRYCPNIDPFDEIFAAELSFEEFSRLSAVFFSYFIIHIRLFDGVNFQYSKMLVIFLFSPCSDFFLIWEFCFYCCFSTQFS